MAELASNQQYYEQLDALEKRGWTTVYSSWHSEDNSNGGSYCAFVPPSYRERALRAPEWDLMLTEGRPGFSQGYENGEYRTRYERGAPFEEIEPLVIHRTYHGSAPDHMEINQEFRLFHNLYWDGATSEYKLPEDDGTLSTAIRYSDDLIQVRTKLLRSFQAARQRDFLLFLDSVIYYEAVPETIEEFQWEEESTRARLFLGDSSFSGRPFVRFLATRVQPAPPVETCGIWPYEVVDADAFPPFMYDIDDKSGEPIFYTCNPDELANYFGANPEAPHYLTSICFRREVLQKYYDNPELYSVNDGTVWCGSLWMLRIDNHSEDFVRVFLGDLGRDLPRNERYYWKTFNVAPEAGISETTFRRAFLGQFAEATALDLVFRSRYRDLQNAWQEVTGWPLFLEPEPADRSMLNRVRLPLNDSQTEFETALALLVKLLVDSLNEAEISKHLPSKIENEKGISKFERLLSRVEYENTARDVALLRSLQELRSRGTAHRKGQNYEKVLEKNLGAERGKAAIAQLLRRSIDLLGDLITWVRDDADDDEAPGHA